MRTLSAALFLITLAAPLSAANDPSLPPVDEKPVGEKPAEGDKDAKPSKKSQAKSQEKEARKAKRKKAQAEARAKRRAAKAKADMLAKEARKKAADAKKAKQKAEEKARREAADRRRAPVLKREIPAREPRLTNLPNRIALETRLRSVRYRFDSMVKALELDEATAKLLTDAAVESEKAVDKLIVRAIERRAELNGIASKKLSAIVGVEGESSEPYKPSRREVSFALVTAVLPQQRWRTAIINNQGLRRLTGYDVLTKIPGLQRDKLNTMLTELRAEIADESPATVYRKIAAERAKVTSLAKKQLTPEQYFVFLEKVAGDDPRNANVLKSKRVRRVLREMNLPRFKRVRVMRILNNEELSADEKYNRIDRLLDPKNSARLAEAMKKARKEQSDKRKRARNKPGKNKDAKADRPK